MREIMKDGGGNQYKMPHSHIRERQQEDPSNVVDYVVPWETYNYSVNTLNELRHTRDNLS